MPSKSDATIMQRWADLGEVHLLQRETNEVVSTFELIDRLEA